MGVTVEKTATLAPLYNLDPAGAPVAETAQLPVLVAPSPPPTVFQRARGALTQAGAAVFTLAGIGGLLAFHEVGVALVVSAAAATVAGGAVVGRMLSSSSRDRSALDAERASLAAERASVAQERSSMAQERATLASARANFDGAVKQAATELIAADRASLAADRQALEGEREAFALKMRNPYLKVGSPEHLSALSAEAAALTSKQREALKDALTEATENNAIGFALDQTYRDDEPVESVVLPIPQILGSLVARGSIYAGQTVEYSSMVGVWHADCVQLTSVRQLLDYAGVPTSAQPEANAG